MDPRGVTFLGLSVAILLLLVDQLAQHVSCGAIVADVRVADDAVTRERSDGLDGDEPAADRLCFTPDNLSQMTGISATEGQGAILLLEGRQLFEEPPVYRLCGPVLGV